jgi:hypothetical protein
VRGRAVLTGVLAWVLVVAVASGVTWAVIEGAGQNLLAGEDPVAETLPVPTPAPSESVPSLQPSAKPSRHRRPDPSSATSSSAAASPTALASRRPATTTTPAPRASASEDAGVERTWEGPPGLVTVRCVGPRTTLRSATPSNGYRVEVDRGAVRIEVHFESASREYKVVARCSGGVPRFAVEGGSEGGHDE